MFCILTLQLINNNHWEINGTVQKPVYSIGGRLKTFPVVGLNELMESRENGAAPLYVVAITTASCIISSLGSLMIIITFILWPELRTEIRRILFYLSIACLCSVCAILPGVTDVLYDRWDSNLSNSTSGCVAESAISIFFTTSSFFWTVALVFYLWLTVRTGTIVYKCAEYLLTYFHIVCWGVPFVTAVSGKCIYMERSLSVLHRVEFIF